MLNPYARNANFTQIILNWLAFMVAITFLAGLVYATVQQTLRQSANDPQIQMSEDAANALAMGKDLQTVLPSGTVNMANSLAPYLIIFNEAGKPLASSVQLDGVTPVVPSGVFGEVAQQGQERFTWQPETGVRSAAVVTHYKGANTAGFVLAGRSLREVEKREDQILLLAGLAWFAACLVITLVFVSPFIPVLKLLRKK
jgi:hypothetical protein